MSPTGTCFFFSSSCLMHLCKIPSCNISSLPSSPKKRVKNELLGQILPKIFHQRGKQSIIVQVKSIVTNELDVAEHLVLGKLKLLFFIGSEYVTPIEGCKKNAILITHYIKETRQYKIIIVLTTTACKNVSRN